MVSKENAVIFSYFNIPSAAWTSGKKCRREGKEQTKRKKNLQKCQRKKWWSQCSSTHGVDSNDYVTHISTSHHLYCRFHTITWNQMMEKSRKHTENTRKWTKLNGKHTKFWMYTKQESCRSTHETVEVLSRWWRLE